MALLVPSYISVEPGTHPWWVPFADFEAFTMKVAALQMTSGPDVSANLAVAGELLAEAAAAEARLAALPENFAFMGLADSDKLAVAEPEGKGPIQQFLSDAARRLRLWVVGGTVPLRLDGERRVAAASLLFDAAGNVVARYDKIHLFDVDIPGRSETYRDALTGRHCCAHARSRTCATSSLPLNPARMRADARRTETPWWSTTGDGCLGADPEGAVSCWQSSISRGKRRFGPVSPRSSIACCNLSRLRALRDGGQAHSLRV